MRHLLRHFRSASVAVLFAVLVAVNGCDIRKYSVMTRIEPDGRLNRGVSIPRDWTLPPEALVAPKTYPPSTQPGDYILNKEWADLWSQESPELKAGVGESGKTIVAGGEFPSAEHIPRNYHLIAYPLDDRASTNRIDHSLDDCLLFNVDNWTETITETVQLGEFVDTVDEMALMLLPPFQTTVDDILGKEYDFKDLHTFGRERLDPLVRDFVLLLYEAAGAGFGAKPRPQDLPVMKNRLRTIGFDLPLNESGDDVDGDKMSTVLTDYVRDLFRTTVRLRATGRYLNTEQAEQLMKRFGWEPEKDSTSRPASGPATATSPTSQPATQESSVWDSIAEAFPQRFEVMNGRTLEAMWFLWGARIGGANRGSPIGFFDPVVKPDNREFSYELETVGPILETNGRRIADNKVRWTFSVADLWPNGYRMTATAVRWNREAERKLFGRVVLTDVEVVLMVREAVTRHENVRNALKQSIEKGNLGPLQTLGAAGEADEHKAARDILKLATRPAS